MQKGVISLSLIVDIPRRELLVFPLCWEGEVQSWVRVKMTAQRSKANGSNAPLYQVGSEVAQMDNGSSKLQQQALQTLSALAQSTRLEAFRLLAISGHQGITAGAIARHLGTPHNTLSTHLAILQKAGLISSERIGRNVTYYLVPGSLTSMIDFLNEDCCTAMPE